MKLLLLTLAITLMSINLSANPLLEPYNTPFNAPPFEKIKPEHFMPAFREGIKRHDDEIAAIVNTKQAPTFENTIEALERSGELLNEVATIFFNLTSANTNEQLQKVAQEAAPLLSEHGDNVALNPGLFKRVQAVYKQKDKLKLTPEQETLLNETYKSFVRGGAALDASKQERFREINQQLSLATLKFGENLLAETNGFKLVVENKAELTGLPESFLEGSKDENGKYVFTLNNPSVMPFLQYADNRALREKMYRAYSMRGNNGNEHDNKEIIKTIVNLQLERSKLLGYKTFADYTLEETMAKTPAKVDEFLMKLWKPAIEVAKKEAADLQKMINDSGEKFKLEPWDWRYYAEKLRKAKYDLDEEELRPYLKLENVRDGVFELANRLYGIKFVERKDVPKYSEEATAYEALNPDGSHLAILYMDFHPRASKRGGAWMTNYREQYHRKSGENVPPIISVVCNFSRPAGDNPALLNWDETETLFHEFGHALHGMFSSGTYRSINGTNVPRDFVELPSQIMENWVAEPQVLKMFAKHYKTGEPMPDALIQKIRNSSLFNQGFATTEYLAASLLDMKYYTMTEPFKGDVNQFEEKTLKGLGLIPEIISRYRSTYFNHIFAGGYSAGYYSYIWAGVLDSDAFELFKQKGIFDRATAASFRTNVLEKGRSEDVMKLYVRFRGAEPDVTPLLKKRGLIGG
ncbi:MAG: M3 family metallopeptidase [Chloroflexota bacterium]